MARDRGWSMTRRFVGSSAIVYLSVSLCLNVSAQSPNATLGGTITDVAGAVMPGVMVTATNTQTGIVTTVVSNETGIYNFLGLQPSVYKLAASFPGFLTQTRTDVQLGTAPLRINFTLPLASINQTVEVSTPVDALMAASSASAGDVVYEFMLRRLPIVGNDALRLVRMLPGVSFDNDQSMMAPNAVL